MDAAAIQRLLAGRMPDCRVEVRGADGHFSIRVETSHFEGLNMLGRQRWVYGHIQDLITEGTIHAVNIQATVPGP